MKARGRCAALMLVLAWAAMGPAYADIKASLDTQQIAVGDTVQLTLEHDGRASGQPDLTPLQQSFDILGTSSSTMIELVNGSASQKTEVVLTLAAKHGGHLTIPAITWDGERSQPLSLTVSGPDGAAQPDGTPAQAVPTVFMETSVSPEQPYVQAAVQLTVRLFAADTLYHADLELPESGDVVAKQVGSDETSAVERNGRSYQVFTRHYLLFPLHSGKLTLQGPVLDAELAMRQPRRPFGADPFGGGFFGGPLLRTVRPVRVHGKPIVLAVRARPANAVGSYWLPARDVTLSAAWTPAKLTAQAGDPVTLDLTLTATGLTAAQLPDLASLLSLPPGLKSYPDQPKLDDSARSGTLVGTRDQTIAFMADSPGRYTIPALTVSWWDTQTNQPRVVRLAARTLSIVAAAGSAPATASTASGAPSTSSIPSTSGVAAPPASTTPTPAGRAAPAPAPGASQHAPTAASAQKSAPANGSSEWEWISLGLATVWLATLAGWLWSRRARLARTKASPPRHLPPAPPQAAPEPGRERAAFRAACEANDAHAARAHLLSWATALWGTTPAGVSAIAARLGNAAVADLLRDLDRACYAGGAWQGQALGGALAELPPPHDRDARARNGLAPLYP
ncbi:MAG TPA: BatD family protein [Steroidobacteraceae bacterium]|nr:BatD family protein [Steroidobacteraceae bacterium]